MNSVQNKKRANKTSLPFFLKDEFKVSFIIVFISIILLITTFTFDIVPPILNRGIQPATFPKALLVLIISLTTIIYYLSIKKPWKVEKKLPKEFFLTLFTFILFIIISKTLDFFLAISALSIVVSYYWGEKRIFYLLLVSIIFPLIVFIFFETILGLRFPPGIITNIYYN
jgi:putative tricarboxylic transport membrane protein|tara:strand:+ start:340 stop:849 length:510 start_codon:yes stop_codon:yes gene_type:complete